MTLFQRIELARLWRREYRRVRGELETHTQRELSTDLGLNRSDIPDIAAEAADQKVAAFVRSHPGYDRRPRGGFAAPLVHIHG